MSDKMFPEFVPFEKIPRLMRTMIVTEKIDGTNAQIYITDDGDVFAGSRKRWITPSDDNYGFATWVENHKNQLRIELGSGRHYGEWWGSGINRRYGQTEKHFSLFNVKRWQDADLQLCRVVPKLYEGDFSETAIEGCLNMLELTGSYAALGYDNPEGVVIYLPAANALFKRTIKDDDKGKEFGA